MTATWALVRGHFAGSARVAAAAALLALLALVAAYAVGSGLAWRSAVESEQALQTAKVESDRVDWFTWLEKHEAGEAIPGFRARPMGLPTLAQLPPGPLAELAFRREALFPSSALLTGFSNEALLFRRYELAGPATLAHGAIDLTFVAVVLMPLVVLLLGHNALSAERDSGRLALLLAQGARTRRLVAIRVLAGALPAWLIVATAAAVAAALGDHPARWSSLAEWLLVVTVYWMFWVALTALLAAVCHRSVTAALAAAGVWVALVVVLPSLAQFTAAALHPPPSRVALLSEARTAEGAAQRDVERRVEAFMAEHSGEVPLGDNDAPGFHRSGFLANLAVSTEVRQVLQAFEDSRSARERVLRWVQLASPALLAHQALGAAAGAGPARAASFQRQVREHLGLIRASIGPAVVGGARLSSEAARAIPPFRFVEVSTGARGVGAALYLAILTLLAALAFTRRVEVATAGR